jgi:hypothetical protein
MRIPREIRKSVAFIGYSDIAGKKFFAGTGFMLIRGVAPEGGLAYFVTAKHVIDGIRDKGCDSVSVRFNFRDGTAQWVDGIPLTEWHTHPTDKSVDVSVMRVPGGLHALADVETFPLDRCVSSEIIEKYEIGIGNELFFPGLFVNHVETRQNIPIVRAGNIAAMVEEKVNTTAFGPIDAYLVEVRSIGGLSGSPVFVHLGAFRVKDGKVMHSPNDHGIFFLLGLMHGHWNSNGITDLDTATPLSDQNGDARINMGIGIVVPAEKIIEVIGGPAIREKDDKEIEAHRASRLPIEDSVDNEESPFT